MSKRITGMIALMLMSASGFSEVIITAEDHAVDSDVVLESAVREVKSIPADTINVIGDTITYLKDETEAAVNGVKAVLEEDAHANAQLKAELAVEDAWDVSNNILFRSYKVSDDIGDLLMADREAETNQSIDVSGFFAGISFPERTSIYYQPEFKSLFVRQTMPNLLAIENILSEYQNEQRELMGHQVEIEARFVEVNQSTLDELGFGWRFGSKGGGDLEIFDDLVLPAGQDILAAGLRTASSVFGGTSSSAGLLTVSKTSGSLRWDLFISAMEQANDADVLSAPRVVTLDGSTAVIQVGEEQMIPKAFDTNNSDSSPYVEHADWELELMGVSMEVTPVILEDGLIDLELHPVIQDLIGFDSYQVTPTNSAFSHYANRQVTDPSILTASLPYMRIRELETNVTVADGNTIAMGGLIYDKLETFRDKVPLLGSIPYLGRLFRSEGERNVKRNLMIFVTATQVDIKGQTAADLVLK